MGFTTVVDYQGMLSSFVRKGGNELKTIDYFIFLPQILVTVDYLYCTFLPIFTITQVHDGGCDYYHSSGFLGFCN